MAVRGGDIRFDILADAENARRGFDQARKHVKGLGDDAERANKKFVSFDERLKRTGRALDGLGNKLTARVSLPLLGLGAVAFKAASDLQESQSKVKVVFAESAASVEAFAKSSAKNLGVSQQAALEAAGTFGNLFRALGLGTKPAADMSTELVKLASDLASFNNANPEEVLLALRSGLVGEAEPLRKFGVSLSAARIEAEAFSLGLAKPTKSLAKIQLAQKKVEESTRDLTAATKKHGAGSKQALEAQVKLEKSTADLEKAMEGQKVELTAAQKAQAAYSVIMKDTTLAQGDFARTASGAANQQRILKARFQDAAATIGTRLLPVGLKLLDFAGNLLTKFQRLSPGTQDLALKLGALAVASGPALKVFGNLLRIAGPFSQAMIGVTRGIRGVATAAEGTAAISKYGQALGLALRNPAVLGWGAVAVAIAAGLKLSADRTDTARKALDRYRESTKRAVAAQQDLSRLLGVEIPRSQLDLVRAQRDLSEAQREYNGYVSAGTETSREGYEAWLRYRDAQITVEDTTRSLLATQKQAADAQATIEREKSQRASDLHRAVELLADKYGRLAKQAAAYGKSPHFTPRLTAEMRDLARAVDEGSTSLATIEEQLDALKVPREIRTKIIAQLSVEVEALILRRERAVTRNPRGSGGGRLVERVHSGGPVFHAGGPVTRMHSGGPLSARERPAILEVGEFVVQKRAVDAIGVAALSRLNRVTSSRPQPSLASTGRRLPTAPAPAAPLIVGGLTINVVSNTGDPKKLARELARPMYDELCRIQRRMAGRGGPFGSR